MEELVDAHELLIQEHELLEHDYDRLRVAKMRMETKLRSDIDQLRRQLRQAVLEIEELQRLLERSYVKA